MNTAIIFVLTMLLTLALVTVAAFAFVAGNETMSMVSYMAVVPLWWVMGELAERLS